MLDSICITENPKEYLINKWIERGQPCAKGAAERILKRLADVLGQSDQRMDCSPDAEEYRK